MGCAPAYWIGNGLCDNGGRKTGQIGDDGFPLMHDEDITFMPDTSPDNLAARRNQREDRNKVAYNFNCDEFWADGGDCESKDQTIQDGYYAKLAVSLALQVGDHQVGVPTLAVVVVAVVGIIGVAMR